MNKAKAKAKTKIVPSLDMDGDMELLGRRCPSFFSNASLSEATRPCLGLTCLGLTSAPEGENSLKVRHMGS